VYRKIFARGGTGRKSAGAGYTPVGWQNCKKGEEMQFSELSGDLIKMPKNSIDLLRKS
jgi:hypothetical protein